MAFTMLETQGGINIHSCYCNKGKDGIYIDGWWKCIQMMGEEKVGLDRMAVGYENDK